jgi:hypothetical protein
MESAIYANGGRFRESVKRLVLWSEVFRGAFHLDSCRLARRRKSVAPTALSISRALIPALTRWANVCRASGAGLEIGNFVCRR